MHVILTFNTRPPFFMQNEIYRCAEEALFHMRPREGGGGGAVEFKVRYFALQIHFLFDDLF